jgi:endoglucanase
VLPPGVAPTKPFFKVAADNYTPKEFNQMRDAGADSVRIQVAQPGMDPQNHQLHFRDRVIGAIRSARAAGLTVIVSIQDEPQTGETKPAELPNAATRRVWQEIAPVFGHDRGVLFELLNEPRLKPSSQNWKAWAQAMNETIHTVRKTGAVNVVVADGLAFGEQLEHAPLLSDPLGQVAYASHPYAHRAIDQVPSTWDKKFGNFSRKAPVIVTEWGTGYHCDANTPASVVSFLQYLQNHGIGLEAATWDWQPAGFGSVVNNFPQGQFSSFVGSSGSLSCKDSGFGPGKTVEAWYRTGVPPTSPQ